MKRPDMPCVRCALRDECAGSLAKPNAPGWKYYSRRTNFACFRKVKP